MQECKDFIKEGLFPGQEGPTLRFCWHPTVPGNGVERAYFVCRSHKNCPFRARAVMLGGSFYVQVVAGVEHSNELTGKTRLNGSLTTHEREKVRELVDGGAKPAAILSSLTAAELKRCEGAKIPLVKRPTGGLAGAYPRRTDEITTHLQNTSKIHRIHLEYTMKIHRIHAEYTIEIF